MNITTRRYWTIPAALLPFFLYSAAAQDDTAACRWGGVVEPISTCAGLESLHAMPDPVNELRIYYFGIQYPQRFIRIRQLGSLVDGGLYLWWPGMQPPLEGASAEQWEQRKEWVMGIRDIARDTWRCGPIQAQPAMETCTVLPAHTPDWNALLRELDSLGIADLPQQPLDRVEFDGTTMVVELRRDGIYRCYSYWMPHLYDDPTERAAAVIMKRLYEVFEP